MKEITMNDLLQADGTFDYQRYLQATENYWNHGRMENLALLSDKSPADCEQPKQVFAGSKDCITISEESLKKMEEMRANRVSLEGVEYLNPKEHKLNLTGTITYVAKLSEIGEELWKKGEGTDAERMGNAYHVLRKEIVSRYSDPDYKPAIVVEDGGKKAHFMTMEEEIAMLDEAYGSITEFRATSAKIMAKFKGKPEFAEELYHKTEQEYFAAKGTEPLEQIKQKAGRGQSRKAAQGLWNMQSQKAKVLQGQRIDLREKQRMFPAGFLAVR